MSQQPFGWADQRVVPWPYARRARTLLSRRSQHRLSCARDGMSFHLKGGTGSRIRDPGYPAGMQRGSSDPCSLTEG